MASERLHLINRQSNVHTAPRTEEVNFGLKRCICMQRGHQNRGGWEVYNNETSIKLNRQDNV